MVLRVRLPAAGCSIQWGEPSSILISRLVDFARGALRARVRSGERVSGGSGSVNTYDYVRYGGWLDAAPRMVAAPGNAIVPNYPFRAFDGDFGFPLDGVGVERAEALLRLAAEVLEADYGYFFVRDVLAGANFMPAPCRRSSLFRSRLARAADWQSRRCGAGS